MRKITGYIGALIIVFALMGSILAGYALNVNGETTVINDYEKVTDISGLYSYSQEKNYIDYAPASNYIGYQKNEQYYTNNGTPTYKKIVNGTITIDNSTKSITVNGVSQGAPPSPNYYFINNTSK